MKRTNARGRARPLFGEAGQRALRGEGDGLIPSGAFFRQLSARAGPVTALCLQFECHAETAEMTCFSRVFCETALMMP